MMEHLPHYFDHIKENPNSLIARIYGVFQVEMEGVLPVNLLLMANTIQKVQESSKIIKVYDLKGSYNHRLVLKGENQTMKDRNLLTCKAKREFTKRPGLLHYSDTNIKHLNKTIDKDVRLFLQKLGLLDYSLLLAVEKLDRKDENLGNLRKNYANATE